MLGPSFSSSEMPLNMLIGADAEADAGTGREQIGPTGAVGGSCFTCAQIVAGAMVAASALARASVLAILRLGKPERATASPS